TTMVRTARMDARRDGRTLAVLIPNSLRRRRSLDSGRPDATGQYPSTTPPATPGAGRLPDRSVVGPPSWGPSIPARGAPPSREMARWPPGGLGRGGLAAGSQRGFDLVEVLAPVGGAQGIQGTAGVEGVHPARVQRRDPSVGFLGQAQGEFGGLPWCDGVDERTRGVVDPVRVRRLVVGGGERHDALQLIGQGHDARVPERDVAQQAGHRPGFVNGAQERLVAQASDQRAQALALAGVRLDVWTVWGHRFLPNSHSADHASTGTASRAGPVQPSPLGDRLGPADARDHGGDRQELTGRLGRGGSPAQSLEVPLALLGVARREPSEIPDRELLDVLEIHRATLPDVAVEERRVRVAAPHPG